MFSKDKRHDIWACGTPEQCRALYGSAYTKTGGTIDPPTPVGNIAATIQSPNLSISSNGQIQNVGNVLGTSVSLSGQKLINGITTANTYMPRVNAPSQVISLSPVDLPGLNLSIPRAVGMGTLPTPVAGQASYVDASLGGSALGSRGPQDLLNNLPPSLQPSSTLFYYNPEEEDLLLQQAALKQTGKSSFVDGLTYDSKRNISVTEQEKEYLYLNALDYSKTHGLQFGVALTQTQVNALDKPMLWYVEQTVPDPTCHATGTATCPTITALMPQVYLPQDTQAMAAGGNISGRDVALKFNQDSNGSILNTGSITASGTLSVDTQTLTNQANQVNVGEIWQKVKGGYLNTTGTTVQPGGFMSAANMDLNVQTLNQIGGALQLLGADGGVSADRTQTLLADIHAKLGSGFTQTTLSDNLHSDFVKEGGSFGMGQLIGMVAAIVLSVYMGPEMFGVFNSLIDPIALAAISPTLAVIGSAAATGLAAATTALAAGAVSQVISTGSLDLKQTFEGAAISGLTAGLTQGLLGSTGITSWGNGVTQASSATTLSNIGATAQNIGGQALIGASVQTLFQGGSFGNALRNSTVQQAAAVGANGIGDAFNQQSSSWWMTTNSPLYALAHAGLGCAASAAEGTGCAGGAIGGAVSAGLNPIIDANGNIPAPALTAIETLVSGSVAGALGFNVQGAMTAAQNETLNNYLNHVQTANLVASLKSCAPGDTACINQVTASYQSISQQQQRRAQNCSSVTDCATVKNDTLSGYGISASDAQSYCQGNAKCVSFVTGLGNQDVAAKSIATTNWNDISTAVYMQNAQQALISSGFSPATAAVLSVATPMDVAGATEAIRGSGGTPSTLYHYTNEAGMNGIVGSGSLNPSLKTLNPNDVRYGNGQYLSDVPPGTMTPAQLSRAFINNPFQGARYTNYVAIDVSGLNVIQGRPGVFVIPNETPLDLTGRIVGSGTVKRK